MAERRPFDGWKRNLSEVLSLSSAAAASLGLPAPGSLVGDPFTAILDTARGWLIGKKRTFTLAGLETALILEDLSVEGSDLARAIGQYGHARIFARDVEWGEYRFERLEIRARNMHLRPGSRPTLVAAPVLCEAFVSAGAASRWLANVSPRMELAMHAGVPQVGLAGAPWVRLEVEAGAGGKSIRIVPRALRVLDRRVSLLRVPGYRVSLPELPFDVTLTSIEPAPGGFVLRGALAEWQRSLSRADLDRLMAAMRASKDRVDPLTGLGRPPPAPASMQALDDPERSQHGQQDSPDHHEFQCYPPEDDGPGGRRQEDHPYRFRVGRGPLNCQHSHLLTGCMQPSGGAELSSAREGAGVASATQACKLNCTTGPFWVDGSGYRHGRCATIGRALCCGAPAEARRLAVSGDR